MTRTRVRPSVPSANIQQIATRIAAILQIVTHDYRSNTERHNEFVLALPTEVIRAESAILLFLCTASRLV